MLEPQQVNMVLLPPSILPRNILTLRRANGGIIIKVAVVWKEEQGRVVQRTQ